MLENKMDALYTIIIFMLENKLDALYTIFRFMSRNKLNALYIQLSGFMFENNLNA